MCFAPQQRALFRHLNFQKWSQHGVLCTFWLGNVLRATTACTFSTSQLPRVVWDRWLLTLLTWKCASRHNGVHFFDIATSKSGPYPSVFTLLTWKFASRHNSVHFVDIWTSKSCPDIWCFMNFDLEICFAPHRRALFRHLNFQKWSETVGFWHFWLGNVLRATTACTFSTSQLQKVVHFLSFYTFDLEICFAPQQRALFEHLNFQKRSGNGVLCAFWLGNVFRPTTACTFSTSELPKVVRTCRALWILTWKSASRHNGVHFFDISTSKSGLRPLAFDTFDLVARRCGTKHISKSKCTKHTMFGPLMPKKCTLLWREAHFQVKCVKNWGGSDHFWTFRCRNSVHWHT